MLNLKLPEQPKMEIGVWEQRHKNYMMHHHKILYTNLLTSFNLVEYLADIDKEITDMFDRFVKQLTKQKGVAEQLKAENQMLQVVRMGNICNHATEIVNNELIYV